MRRQYWTLLPARNPRGSVKFLSWVYRVSTLCPRETWSIPTGSCALTEYFRERFESNHSASRVANSLYRELHLAEVARACPRLTVRTSGATSEKRDTQWMPKGWSIWLTLMPAKKFRTPPVTVRVSQTIIQHKTTFQRPIPECNLSYRIRKEKQEECVICVPSVSFQSVMTHFTISAVRGVLTKAPVSSGGFDFSGARS